ncbi:MAG: MOSC domain-containing protein [Planctomycetota bacterium]|jgi:MOSC domain-containing protein YiiM
MARRGEIVAVCTSTSKGGPKRPVQGALLVKGHGIEGDAHAGTAREVSLLCEGSAEKIRERGLSVSPGDFAENLLISGLEAGDFELGRRVLIRTDGHEALLEVTQIGKECHSGCAIREQVGDCVMPREGVFARVLKGGPVCPGSVVEVSDAD